MNKHIRRAGIVAGALGAAGAMATASFAFFTATTAVTATGSTKTVQAAVVTDASVETLRPGVCGDVTFTIHNQGDVDYTGISGVNSVAVGASGAANGHLHLAPYLHAGATYATDLVGHGYTFGLIAAGTGQQVTLKDAVCMDLGASDAAQGQAVEIDLDLVVKERNGTEYTSVS